MNKTIEYWKINAEEDYKTTPISVLKYIAELERPSDNLITKIRRRLSILTKSLLKN